MEETDEALMAAVAGGDAAALSALYDRYERPTFNLILRLAGRRDVAEELMQEAFTRLWTTARLFRGERGSFKPWLFTIALNLTRSELSRKRYRVRHLEPEAAEELPALTAGPELLAVRAQEAERVVAAVARLSPLLREIVVLRMYQQLKFAEIARLTGAPEGTLKARFHRAARLSLSTPRRAASRGEIPRSGFMGLKSRCWMTWCSLSVSEREPPGSR